MRKFLSLGVLDPKESLMAKRWSRGFDVVMLLIIFWLPLQWHLEQQGALSQQFIVYSNWLVWSYFLLEMVVMTSIVSNKSYYLMTNWLNLVILVLIYPPLLAYSTSYWALLRYLRIIVLLRMILPQLVNLHRILSRNQFGATLIAFLVVTVLSGVLVSYLDPHIGSPWEGIWWAWQTVTTVGYGDVVPTNVAGKIFAAILMLIGVGMFSLVSANLAAYFIERGRRQKEKKPERAIQKQFREVNERLEQMEQTHQRLEDLLYRVLAQNAPDKDKSPPDV